MKSINPIQKYAHIIESYACILKISVIFLFPMNFKFHLGYVQLLNYQNILYYLHSQIKLFIEFLFLDTHQDLLHMPHRLF